MTKPAALAITFEGLDAHGQPLSTKVTLYATDHVFKDPTSPGLEVSPETLRLIKTGALPLAEIFNPTPAPSASTRTPLIYEEQ